MVMERLVGETLADRVAAEGGLPFEDVIDTLVQVLSALVAAHEQGIVHRDIKPENVFLTKRVGIPPIVKLLDFGVSKVTGGARDELALTRTGMVMGTPYYMAPEQARGDRDLDARVDLYACGVMLYEALTGKRPFTASNYNALLVQILNAKPRPARALRPALPAGYDAVLDKALARDREDRYATAADFQRDLQALRDRHNAQRIGLAPETTRGQGPGRVSRDAPREPVPSSSAEVPSSMEIPITITTETPAALAAPDPTEVFVRVPESSRSEHGPNPGDAEPTQLMVPAKPRRR
jgi:serine/threonine protein kinase